MRYLCLLICVCCILASCDKRIIREVNFVENFDKAENRVESYKKAVVLIRNQYYYIARYSSGHELEFFIDKSGKVIPYRSREEAESNPRIAYGTGFFISPSGQIATNRHVINPVQPDDAVLKELNRIYSQKLQNTAHQLDSIESHIKRIELLLNRKSGKAFVSTQKENLEKQLLDLKSDKTLLASSCTHDFNPLQTVWRTKRTRLEVILRDGMADQNKFADCTVQNESSDFDLDLAIIAVKNNRELGLSPAFVDLDKTKSYLESSEKDEVFMIGFSLQLSNGESLGNLQPDIKNGTIEKMPSSKRLQYSISSFPGSSGSPIMDKHGNLIAVNFAKTLDDVNLSFGIPAEYLADLEKNNIRTTIRDTTIERSKEGITLKPAEINEGKEVIEAYFEAEDSRDLSKIMSFFDAGPVQYFDAVHLSHSGIADNFRNMWKRSVMSRNTIKSITSEQANTFKVRLEFEYVDLAGSRNSHCSDLLIVVTASSKIRQILRLKD